MGCEGSGVQISPSRPFNYSETSPFSSAFVTDPRSTPIAFAQQMRTYLACEGCEAKPSHSGVQISPSRPFNYSETSPFSSAFVTDPRSTPIAFAQQMRTYLVCEGCEAKPSHSGVQISPSRPLNSPSRLKFNGARILSSRPRSTPIAFAQQMRTFLACEGCEAKPSHSGVQISPSRPFNYSETSPFSSAFVTDPRSTPIAFAQQMRTYLACEGCEAKPSHSGVQISPSRPLNSPSKLKFNGARILSSRPRSTPIAFAQQMRTNLACEGCDAKPSHSGVQISPSRPLNSPSKLKFNGARILSSRPRSTPIAFAQQMRTYLACEGCEAKPSHSGVQISPSRPLRSVKQRAAYGAAFLF